MLGKGVERIVVDMDDTTGDTNPVWVKYAMDSVGDKYPRDLVDVGRLSPEAPLELKELRKRFFKDEAALMSIKPTPGAHRTYMVLSQGRELNVLSGRPIDMRHITRTWYQQNGLEPFTTGIYHCSPAIKDRVMAKVITSIGWHATAVVEDDEEIAETISKFGIFVCLIDKPWNNHLKEGSNLRKYESLGELATDLAGMNSFGELIRIHRLDYPKKRLFFSPEAGRSLQPSHLSPQ